MTDGEGSGGSDESSSGSSSSSSSSSSDSSQTSKLKNDSSFPVEGTMILFAVGLISLFLVLGYVSTRLKRRKQLKKLQRYPVQLVSMTTPNTSMLEV